MAKIAQWLSNPWLPLMLAALAVMLALPSLWTGLVLDDYFHYAAFRDVPVFSNFFSPMGMFSFVDGNAERTRLLMDIGVLPWWTLEGLRWNLWRPLAVFTHWLDYTLWPDHFWLMHFHSLAWMGALVVVVTLLYRRIMGAGWMAGLAALGYAVDDAHALPICWLANRNALLAAFFGACTILFHDRWRRDGKRWAALFALISLALGVGANEGAIAACAYLFAYAVFIDGGGFWRRMLSLVPYALLVVIYRACYQWGGYGAWGSAAYLDPIASPVGFLKALLVREPILLLRQWAIPPSSVFVSLPKMGTPAMLITAVLCLIALVILFVPLLRRLPVARFWCLGMVLALVPSCAANPDDRLLLFSGLGAMGLLAQFVNAAGKDLYLSFPLVRRALVWPVCAILILVHLILAPVLLPLEISRFAAYGAQLVDVIDRAPLDQRAKDQIVVVTNATNHHVTSGLQILKAVQGEPIPGHVRGLAPISHRRVPLYFTRTDDRTLKMRSEGGFPWSLFRDDDHPFAPGDRVELTGMTVQITSPADEGWPVEVTYRFSVPLEHPSLVWLQLEDGLEPFIPPAVDETVVLNR